MISDYGVEFVQQEDGSYKNEQGTMAVFVKDNLVHEIELVQKTNDASLSNIQVGDKKKRVEKTLGNAYKENESTIIEENGFTMHEYESENRILRVFYDDKNIVQQVFMEVTTYKVEDSSSHTSNSNIDKNAIMIRVGNIDVCYSEAMVYLRIAQEIYETEFGNDVWSYDLYGNGTTVGAVLKQEVLNQIIQLEIINVVASEKGITLSDDELYEVRNEAADYIQQIPESEKVAYGFTQDLVVRVFAANRLAEKLYETVTIDIDTDVSDEEAQQCKIDRLFLRNYGTDSKGNRIPLRDSELEDIRNKMKELHEKALNGEDFYALADSNSDEDTIEFVIGRGDLSEAEEKIAFSLNDGEVSDIIELDDGYVILYCVDSYDEDATLQVKEQIIEQRRSDLFVELYTQWYSNYEVKVNMELWNKLELAPIQSLK